MHGGVVDKARRVAVGIIRVVVGRIVWVVRVVVRVSR